MKVLVATIMIISFFIDILIDIQSIYCSTSIRVSTHVFDHFAACTSFELG